jgi:hypothetical protein
MRLVVSTLAQKKSPMNCSILRVHLMIEIFCSKHIIALGPLDGFVERLQTRMRVLTLDWTSMMRFDMRDTGSSTLATIRLFVLCRLRQCCNGFWAIQPKAYGWNAMRSKDGLAAWNRLGARGHLCLSFCLLAETYFAAGQYEQGMEQANLAIATSSEMGDRWCQPRIHTIRARLLQTFGQVEAAEASLQMAVDIAAGQSTKGAQLHAANFLARLWRDQGKVQQARELLTPVYGWFTEGFDTRDLKEAKALLEELAA